MLMNVTNCFSKAGICFLSVIAFLVLFYEVFYYRLSLRILSITQTVFDVAADTGCP